MLALLCAAAACMPAASVLVRGGTALTSAASWPFGSKKNVAASGPGAGASGGLSSSVVSHGSQQQSQQQLPPADAHSSLLIRQDALSSHGSQQQQPPADVPSPLLIRQDAVELVGKALAPDDKADLANQIEAEVSSQRRAPQPQPQPAPLQPGDGGALAARLLSDHVFVNATAALLALRGTHARDFAGCALPGETPDALAEALARAAVTCDDHTRSRARTGLSQLLRTLVTERRVADVGDSPGVRDLLSWHQRAFSSPAAAAPVVPAAAPAPSPVEADLAKFLFAPGDAPVAVPYAQRLELYRAAWAAAAAAQPDTLLRVVAALFYALHAPELGFVSEAFASFHECKQRQSASARSKMRAERKRAERLQDFLSAGLLLVDQQAMAAQPHGLTLARGLLAPTEPADGAWPACDDRKFLLGAGVAAVLGLVVGDDATNKDAQQKASGWCAWSAPMDGGDGKRVKTTMYGAINEAVFHNKARPAVPAYTSFADFFSSAAAAANVKLSGSRADIDADLKGLAAVAAVAKRATAALLDRYGDAQECAKKTKETSAAEACSVAAPPAAPALSAQLARCITLAAAAGDPAPLAHRFPPTATCREAMAVVSRANGLVAAARSAYAGVSASGRPLLGKALLAEFGAFTELRTSHAKKPAQAPAVAIARRDGANGAADKASPALLLTGVRVGGGAPPPLAWVASFALPFLAGDVAGDAQPDAALARDAKQVEDKGGLCGAFILSAAASARAGGAGGGGAPWTVLCAEQARVGALMDLFCASAHAHSVSARARLEARWAQLTQGAPAVPPLDCGGRLAGLLRTAATLVDVPARRYGTLAATDAELGAVNARYGRWAAAAGAMARNKVPVPGLWKKQSRKFVERDTSPVNALPGLLYRSAARRAAAPLVLQLGQSSAHPPTAQIAPRLGARDYAGALHLDERVFWAVHDRQLRAPAAVTRASVDAGVWALLASLAFDGKDSCGVDANPWAHRFPSDEACNNDDLAHMHVVSEEKQHVVFWIKPMSSNADVWSVFRMIGGKLTDNERFLRARGCLEALLDDDNYAGYTVSLAAHSLGGAVAIKLASEFGLHADVFNPAPLVDPSASVQATAFAAVVGRWLTAAVPFARPVVGAIRSRWFADREASAWDLVYPSSGRIGSVMHEAFDYISQKLVCERFDATLGGSATIHVVLGDPVPSCYLSQDLGYKVFRYPSLTSLDAWDGGHNGYYKLLAFTPTRAEPAADDPALSGLKLAGAGPFTAARITLEDAIGATARLVTLQLSGKLGAVLHYIGWASVQYYKAAAKDTPSGLGKAWHAVKKLFTSG